MRYSCWSEWRVVPPGVEAIEVDGCGRQKVLEAGFGQTLVAGSAESVGSDALSHSSFHSRAVLVTLLPSIGLLFGAAQLESLVLSAMPDGEPSTRTGAGALRAGRAGSAGRMGECDFDDRDLVLGSVGFPARGGGALGTGDPLVVPVDREVAQGIAAVGCGLPPGGRLHRTQ